MTTISFSHPFLFSTTATFTNTKMRGADLTDAELCPSSIQVAPYCANLSSADLTDIKGLEPGFVP